MLICGVNFLNFEFEEVYNAYAAQKHTDIKTMLLGRHDAKNEKRKRKINKKKGKIRRELREVEEFRAFKSAIGEDGDDRRCHAVEDLEFDRGRREIVMLEQCDGMGDGADIVRSDGKLHAGIGSAGGHLLVRLGHPLDGQLVAVAPWFAARRCALCAGGHLGCGAAIDGGGHAGGQWHERGVRVGDRRGDAQRCELGHQQRLDL